MSYHLSAYTAVTHFVKNWQTVTTKEALNCPDFLQHLAALINDAIRFELLCDP